MGAGSRRLDAASDHAGGDSLKGEGGEKGRRPLPGRREPGVGSLIDDPDLRMSIFSPD